MNTKSKNIAVYCFNKINPLARRVVLQNESGVALIVALLLMVAMISIIPVAMHLTAQDIKRTSDFAGNRDAFYLAEAGIHHAGALYQDNDSNDIMEGADGSRHATATDPLNDDNGNFYTAGTNFSIASSSQVTETSALDGNDHIYTQVSFEGGTYKIRIWDNTDSALCPAGCTAGNADPTYNTDYESWVDRDGLVYAESIGTTSKGETVTIAATFKRKTIPASMIPAAVVLVGPKASVEASSANYDVTGASSTPGSGYDISGSTDAECTGKSGISIEALGATAPNFDDYVTTNTNNTDLLDCEVPTAPPNQWNDVCISLTNQARTGIEGTNNDGGNMGSPDPDITLNDQTFTADDAAKLYEDVITNGTPDQTMANPDNSASITNWGSITNPVVIHAPGDLQMAGNNTGYGILVVDGDFTMAGITTWNGIILVGACPTCTGKLTGVGTLTANGTVIIGNDTTSRSVSDFAGTARFNYSCEGIAIANGAYKDTFKIVAWNEITVE